MYVFCPNSVDQLLTYAKDWEHLAAGIPFRSWTWLHNWWHHYGPRTAADESRIRLAVLCVCDDASSLMGLAPFYIQRSSRHGRVLRLLGTGEVCSDYLGLLCHPGAEDLVAEALAEYLVHCASSDGPRELRWDLLELSGVDASDKPAKLLVDYLSAEGCTTHCRAGVNCWRIDLPTSWEQYLESLGKNLRRDLRRLEREMFQNGRAKCCIIDKADELPYAMKLLVQLHQRRHNKLGQAGCFASPRFLSFYGDVVPELFRSGQLQFSRLEVDGRPLAVEYQLLGGGVLYAYQAGVDPDFLHLQPGKLLNMAIIRRAIEQGYLAFDFLRGDEPYKARFGALPRPSLEYRVAPRRPMAQVRHGLWLAGVNLKQWIKRGIRGVA